MTWNQQVERWLDADAGHTLGRPWYAGRPVLITENDRGLRLYNGDTGITVPAGEGLAVVIAEEDRRRFAPSRLGTVHTAYAMTVHRSQGSQFEGGTADVRSMSCRPVRSPTLEIRCLPSWRLRSPKR